MAIDVDQVLRQYETAPQAEPMHGQQGQVRRNPSTDQKRDRREQQRKQAGEAQEETMPVAETEVSLLRKAAKAQTEGERRTLLHQVEQLRTAKIREQEQSRELDITAARIVDTLIPGPVHELHSSGTDWLTELPQPTASRTEAEHELIAQASLWFERVPEFVKAYPEEFVEQARNMAHRHASQFGDHTEVAERAFLDEAARLHTQAVKGGLQVVGGLIGDIGENYAANDLSHVLPDAIQAHTQHLVAGHDVEGVDQASDAHTRQTLGSFEQAQINRAAALSHEARAADDKQEAEDMFGDNPDDDTKKEAASTLPQVGGPAGLPVTEFATFTPGQKAPEPNTSSNRAPALQELQNFTGYGDSSTVVPQGPSGAAEANDDTSGTQDAASTDPLSSAGFPIGASMHTASKESHMTQAHAECPTCGGQGRVAVRKLAYSGLPQIDQIVNADESPGPTPYPEEVAFPITGWDGGAQIQKTIGEAEQQIANRPQGRPGAPGPGGPGGSVAASMHQANGRDNSGWIGDMGAKGLDYPGYSSPTGYDGSNNLGVSDPVYGEGGDNGNEPKLPYGAGEANDYTNNPGQNWQPGQPTQDDQGWREVANDPMVTAARLEIQRHQQLIEQRAAAIRRQQVR